MSRGINKVILIGNLGADPEIRYTTNGDAVASLRIATSESWKDKTTGELHEKTEWHRVTLWRRLAEVARDYLHKGDRVYIEGKLETRKWQAQDGSDRYSTEIQGREMEMLGTRQQGQDQSNSRQGGYRQQQGRDNGQGRQPQGGGGYQGQQPPMDFNDDIPF